MEHYPFTPFESEDKPEKAGSVEASKKKKKKTTFIPLPVSKEDATKPEAKADANEPETTLEKLFERKEAEELDREIATGEQEVHDDSEIIRESTDQAFNVAETNADSENEEFNEAEEILSIEGEFADEAPVVITRAETILPPEASAELISPNDAEKPAKEALVITEDELQAEAPATKEIDTKVAGNDNSPPPPEAPIFTAFEPEPYPEERMFISPESDSVDTSVRPVAEIKPKIISEDSPDIHRIEKRANSRGVLAGGIFGWFLGRRSGRRQANQEAEQTYRKKDQEISRLQNEQAVLGERLRNVERESQPVPALAIRQETAPLAAPIEMAQSFKNESEPVVKESIASTQELEKQSEKQEQSPEDQPDKEESYQAPAGNRVEMSAWHRYEVDERTGKPVENSSIVYGEAFKKEQRQERLRRKSEPKAAVLLGKAVVSTAGHSRNGNLATAANSLENPPAKTNKKLLIDSAKIQMASYAVSPLIWVAAAVVAVLLFTAGFLR